MSLARRTPLARKTPLKRTPMKRRATSDRAEADEFRRRVMQVDYCQVGVPGCTLRSERAHHVLPRGMGGGSAHDRNLGLACCDFCHRWVHAHPAESYENGWLMRHGSGDG